MPPATLARLTRRRFIEFFVEAAVPRERWRVGMELEKMGRNSSDGKPFPYMGADPAVHALLTLYMSHRGGIPIYEGMHIIGLDGPYGTITLEPAGQFEWSSRPFSSLGDLADALEAHLATMAKIGRQAGVQWLDVAVDPVHPVSEMPWMPKPRYEIMRPYMGEHGRLSHRMMTQTASIQCSYDFENSSDWSRKFRAAALLSPVAVAMFANSPTIDGKDSGFRSYRQEIWRRTDPDRCMLPAAVFHESFDLEAWVDWLCTVPALFDLDNQSLVAGNGIPFHEILKRTGIDAPTMVDMKLLLSSLFTDVRSSTYIEIRCADLQPDHLAMAVPTLWTGILYHPRALDAAPDLGACVDDHSLWREAMYSASRDGLRGEAGGYSLRDLAVELLGLSRDGLESGAKCTSGTDDPAAHLRLLDRKLGLGVMAG